MEHEHVDKYQSAMNNDDRAKKIGYQMLDEFCISHDLKHPNIVEYKYFIREYNKLLKKHEFHNIMEYIDGPDMRTLIQQNFSPSENQIRDIAL